MTAPLRNTQHASTIAAITASQTSAPVAEFRCLFTQDIKRKQKRWQDGYLKFHTFNSRVMVYDQARNFLGDTYYKDSDALQEGDELNLNNGALVEVAEAMGVTHTDLAPLLEKKNKGAPPRPSAASQPKPFQRPSSVASTNAQRNGSQLRHKSLNSLLGTPKGPIRKAQPMKSPYDARKEKENESVEERAPKRQKTTQSPPSWRASSPVQEESPIAKNQVPIQARKLAKFIPPSATLITIVDSEPDPNPAFPSDVTLPSTPPKVTKVRARRHQLATSAPKPFVPDQAPIQTPRIPKGKVSVPSVRALETPKQQAPASSPPVSASNRLSNVEFAMQLEKDPPKEPSPPVPDPTLRKAKSLRLSTGVKRGRLLCQAVPEQIGINMRVKAHKVSLRPSEEPSATRSENDSVPNHRATVVDRKGANDDIAPKRARVSKSVSASLPSLSEDPEVVHGLMDQQLLVPSSPVQAHVASSPPVEISKPKSVIARKKASKKAVVPKSPEAVASKSPSPKPMSRKAQARKQAAEPSAAPPLPLAPIPDSPAPAPQDVSPKHTVVASDAQARTTSTSPCKVLLSNGGFPKRPAKRNKKQSVVANSTLDVAPPSESTRNESVPLPPHPLRASNKGPVMTTSELATVLQHPNSPSKPPAQDEQNTLTIKRSPLRSFRRVRSENDAPIPSTAQAWEQHNLPNPVDDPLQPVTLAPKKKKGGGLDALIKKTDPMRKLQRTQSLRVETEGLMAQVGGVEEASPVKDEDVGPWSTEAGDLFDWRPPGRERA